jgi:hypothetical protein
MSTQKTLLVFALASLFLMGLILINVFTNKREFIVITVKGTDVCFLADTSLKLETLPAGGFRYAQGKNSGQIRLIKGEGKIDPSFTPANINGFVGGYSKGKNIRQYQYQIDSGTLLQDDFIYAQKFPLNLVPYRSECPQFLKSHKHTMEI